MSGFKYILNGYVFLLRLYPSDFRAEFDTEMVSVFASRLHEFSQDGLSLAMVCLRELAELPLNLLREYGNQLTKEIRMITQASAFDPKRTSILGALGFGMGFALLILLRALIDPANDTILTNFGTVWVRETFLFTISGTFGGAFIGLGSRSVQTVKRLALAGGLGCCIAGSLGTLCLYLFYRYGFPDALNQTTTHWSHYLPQLAVNIFIGAVTGASLGTAQNNRQQIVRLAWMGAVSFGAGYMLSKIVFYFVYSVWMNLPFSQFWAIPLASSAGFMGLICGAVLGWAMSKSSHGVLLETAV